MSSAVPIEHCSRVLHAGIQTRDRRSQDLLKTIGFWRRLAEQRSLRKNRKTIAFKCLKQHCLFRNGMFPRWRL
ncbi:hypothetical protein M408DRAFT_332678 [Serendipita vermifera MAFF 305830]|uniref:Uncharacterized protein n=1 Tax=Serendipita vermifera MAFF 305830 TaxID=933852 RepID=A0A0C3AUF3_SERVB|nr:hypothetical protein M408DRAFT_332678 [Serendipita vermifera MAFF 305830]